VKKYDDTIFFKIPEIIYGVLWNNLFMTMCFLIV